MFRRAFLGFGIAATLLVAETPADKLTIYDFNLPDISGKMISFSQYKGKVLLIVNVASNSTYTPQYKSLQAVYEKYKDTGLVVLAFPSNDFGAEEPDPENKIKMFVDSSYHVTFPLFSKVAVRGDEITPLFHFLSKEANPKVKGDIHWNFTKFLVDRKGKVVSRFESDVAPDDPDLLVAIEGALSGKDLNPHTPPSPPQDGPQGKRARAGA